MVLSTVFKKRLDFIQEKILRNLISFWEWKLEKIEKSQKIQDPDWRNKKFVLIT